MGTRSATIFIIKRGDNMNNIPIIQITEPEVTEYNKNGVIVEFKDYSNSHLIYKLEDLGSLEEIRKLKIENGKMQKQLQNISNEFLKYDWERSNKKQIVNQLNNLYNSIFGKRN